MKKLIIPMLLLAMVACKKEEETSTDAPVTFSKEALIGKWNINKFEGLNLANDSITMQMNFNAGDATITFNSNGTYLTKTTFDESAGTFNVLKLNGKDVLVTIETGDRPDSMEIKTFTKSSMVFDDKQFEQRRGSDDYTKAYCSK
ncbi:MAG: hypothetical protein ACOVO9_06425 [Bacteroidia bacterium]